MNKNKKLQSLSVIEFHAFRILIAIIFAFALNLKRKLSVHCGQPLPSVYHHPLCLSLHVFLGVQAVFVLYVLNFSLSLRYLACFSCHFLYFNSVLKHSPFHFRNTYCFSSLSSVEQKICFQFVGVCASCFIFPHLVLQGFICWFYVVFQIQRNLKSKTPLTPSLLRYSLKQ